MKRKARGAAFGGEGANPSLSAMRSASRIASVWRSGGRRILSAVGIAILSLPALGKAQELPDSRIPTLLAWGTHLPLLGSFRLAFQIQAKPDGYSMEFVASPDQGTPPPFAERSCWEFVCYLKNCAPNGEVLFKETCCSAQSCSMLLSWCIIHGQLTGQQVAWESCPIQGRLLYGGSFPLSSVRDPKAWVDTLLSLLGELKYREGEVVDIWFERAHSGEFGVRRVVFRPEVGSPQIKQILREHGFSGEARPGTFQLSDGRIFPDLPVQGYTLPEEIEWEAGRMGKLTYKPPRELIEKKPSWSVQISPNPTSEQVHVQVEGDEPLWLRLYDQEGQNLLREELKEAGTHTVSFSLPYVGRFWLVVEGLQHGQRRTFLLFRQ